MRSVFQADGGGGRNRFYRFYFPKMSGPRGLMMISSIAEAFLSLLVDLLPKCEGHGAAFGGLESKN